MFSFIKQRKKWILQWGIFVVVCIFTYSLKGWFRTSSPDETEDPIVNVCDWYGMLSPDLLRQFEKESGIKVRYDIFDNNEVLEAKLLASNSGYDVVFPSAAPYVSRQIQIGLYQPLNKKSLKGLDDLNPDIVEKMKFIDPTMRFAIPFYWGTLGIAFDYEKVSRLLPDAPLDRYDLLFNPQNLKKLSKCGVSFLEEGADVFPLIRHYFKNEISLPDIEKHLLKLRPYIRRFTSARFMNDLIMGDVCIAQAWSGEAHQAREEVKSMGRRIVYMIPKDGTSLWIDCIAIPLGAPHPKNAHIFINFLMRPDIAARITNRTFIPTTVLRSTPFVKKDIQQDTSIYPSKEVMQNLFMTSFDTSKEGLQEDQKKTKLWIRVRTFKKDR